MIEDLGNVKPERSLIGNAERNAIQPVAEPVLGLNSFIKVRLSVIIGALGAIVFGGFALAGGVRWEDWRDNDIQRQRINSLEAQNREDSKKYQDHIASLEATSAAQAQRLADLSATVMEQSDRIHALERMSSLGASHSASREALTRRGPRHGFVEILRDDKGLGMNPSK